MSLLNLCALGLLAAWAYANGIPDWTTQTGVIFIGSTFVCFVNFAYLIFASKRPAPNQGILPDYAIALAAMQEAQGESRDALRIASMQAIYEVTGLMGSLSAERLVDAARRFQDVGEFQKALDGLADFPVAREIFRLAGQGSAPMDMDAMIRLEGLLAFIHAREPEEVALEAMEAVDVRLDALYSDAAFDLTDDTPHQASAYVDETSTHARQIDYEDVVNATLRIVPIEQISGLPLSERRALFARVRHIMETGGSQPSAFEIDQIRDWVAENIR